MRRWNTRRSGDRAWGRAVRDELLWTSVRTDQLCGNHVERSEVPPVVRRRAELREHQAWRAARNVVAQERAVIEMITNVTGAVAGLRRGARAMRYCHQMTSAALCGQRSRTIVPL